MKRAKMVAPRAERTKRTKKEAPRAEGRIARGQPRFYPILLETSESSEDSCDSTISSTWSAIV
jgi:hypothetical protein